MRFFTVIALFLSFAGGALELYPEKTGGTPGWFFSPGEEITVAVRDAGENPEVTVTDFDGRVLRPVLEKRGTGAVFRLSGLERGYYEIQCGALVQPFAVTGDQSRLATPANRFGINFHLAWIPLPEAVREVETARRAGFGWLRGMHFDWSGCKVPADTDRLFERYRKLHAYLATCPMGQLGAINFTAKYASSAPPDAPALLWSRCAPADLRPLTAFAARYAAEAPFVTHWEFLNEPDADIFWKGRYENLQADNVPGIIEDAVNYHRAAREGILGVNPQAKILYFSGTTMLPEGYFFRPFLAETLRHGIAGRFDIMNAHYLADLERIRAMLEPFGAAGRPIWITEIGTHSGGGSSERLQLRGDVTSEIEQLARGAEKVFKYDFRNDGASRWAEHNFGLVRRDFSPKPAFVAHSVLIGLLHDGNFVKELNLTGSADAGYGKGFAFDSPENGRVNCLWLCGAPKAEVTFDSSLDTLKVIDLMGRGKNLPVRSGRAVLTLDDLPVFVLGEISGAPGKPVYPGETVIARYPVTNVPLLNNGGFNEGVKFWSWHFDATGKVVAIQDPERRSNVLKVELSEPGMKGYGGVGQSIPLARILPSLREGESVYFTLTCDCRKNNVRGAGVGIGVNFLTGGKRVSWRESGFRAGTHDYKELKVTGKIPPGTDTLRIAFNTAPGTVGEIRLDNFLLQLEVRRAAMSPAETTKNKEKTPP